MVALLIRNPQSARVYPLRLAVGPMFLLPDRDQLLEPVDRVTAGGEGVGPVRATDGEGDADLPDLQPAEAVDHDDIANAPAGTHVGFDFGELFLGHAAVGLVVQGDGHLI